MGQAVVKSVIKVNKSPCGNNVCKGFFISDTKNQSHSRDKDGNCVSILYDRFAGIN